MVIETDSPVRTTPSDHPALAVDSAWINRLIRRIGHLPIPAWLFYLLLLGIVYLVINTSRWVQGAALIGSLDAPYAFVALYLVYPLAAIHYLDRTAAGAFDSFRPAMGVTDAEAARLRYELTTLPARGSWIAVLLGFTIFVLMLAYPGGTRIAIGGGIYYWTLLAFTAAGLVLFAELLYHTFRQLRLVSRIHASAKNLDLFHFGPLYSFSALTARTGVAFVLILAFDLAINPETLANLPLVLLNGVTLVLCVACFVLPLYGMHQRIIKEKSRLEFDVNERVEAIVQHLYGQVDGLDLHDADAVNKTISSLVATRELISRIPTWPWQPETVTAFFSALTLPILVFLIQTFLKSLIGFK